MMKTPSSAKKSRIWKLQILCRSTRVDESYAIEDFSEEIDTKVDTRSTQKIHVDRHKDRVDRHVSQTCPTTSKPSVKAEERVYKPKIPYPRAVSVKEPEEKRGHAQPQLRKLQKITNPGMFIVPCSIKGMEFKNSLCDTGANVNVMSQSAARKLGIKDLQPSRMSLKLVDSSSISSKGFIPDLILQVGDCLVPVDFHIMETKNDRERPLILGSSFLATVGAIVDFPNQRISFSKINKDVFYPAVRFEKNASMTVTNGGELRLDPRANTKKVPCVPPSTPPSSRSDGNLTAHKAKRKKKSKPFSKFRIVLPLELREKGEEIVQEMLQNTMKLFPGVVPFTDPPIT